MDVETLEQKHRDYFAPAFVVTLEGAIFCLFNKRPARLFFVDDSKHLDLGIKKGNPESQTCLGQSKLLLESPITELC